MNKPIKQVISGLASKIYMSCSPSGLVVDASPLFGKLACDLDRRMDLPHNDRRTFKFRDVLVIYSKVQISRHLCKILRLCFALYKQPHLAQFRMIMTAWSTTLHIAYYKWSAARRITLQ